MNATPSITSTTTINTLITGFYSSTEGKDVLTQTLITILFTLLASSTGYYFTNVLVNGKLLVEANSRLFLTLVPGDEIEVTLCRDNDGQYRKSLTFSADELGVHATCAPNGIKYTAKSESKARKEIHSKHRPAA